MILPCISLKGFPKQIIACGFIRLTISLYPRKNAVFFLFATNHTYCYNVRGKDWEHESKFVEMIAKKNRSETDKSMREYERELSQSENRIAKLDEVIQRLYEDNIEGKISDERFAKITASYETEQKSLESRVQELESIISSNKENALNTTTS